VLDETIFQNVGIKLQFNEIDFKMLRPCLQSMNQKFQNVRTKPQFNDIDF
jgi:hypothetical protein